jgi:hypothetical protein
MQYMNNNAKQAAQRERYFALRESTIDNIMNKSFRYESILQVIEGVTTTITTNDKDIEFKMRLGWLTEIILV